MGEDNLYPFVFGKNTENIYKVPDLATEVAWDFEKDIPIIEKNEYKYVTGDEAIKVWIYKTIKIARYRYEIFTSDYGTEIDTLVGQKYTKGYTESQAMKYIKDALNINEYITNINIIKASFIGDTLTAHINVDTIYNKGVDFNV